MKVKIHFNRVNMQRNDDRVWSAHTSKSCNMAEKIVVMHNGKVVLETVFRPEAKQPRAYLCANGEVTYKGKTAIVTV